MSGHSDTVESPVHGARDDGLGCAALLEVARALPSRAWNRTVVPALFDEEEHGLVRREAFVRDHGPESGVGFALVENLNFDPAGLHRPCGDALGPFAVLLGITRSTVEGADAVPGYAPLLASVRAGFARGRAAGPRAHDHAARARAGEAEFLSPGSDDDRFDRVDVPSVRMGAPPRGEAGPVGAWGYPNHVPVDTAEFVGARCESAATLRDGLQVALNAAWSALVALDAA